MRGVVVDLMSKLVRDFHTEYDLKIKQNEMNNMVFAPDNVIMR